MGFSIIRWIKGLLPAFIILFFAVCIGCLVWISVWGLPGVTKRWLEGELSKQDVNVSIGQLRISLVGGVYLAANDVVLYNKLVEYQEPSKIDKLRLDLDIGELWEGKFRLERVEIVNGEMSLPPASPGGTAVRLDEVNAVLGFDSGGNVDIREATCMLQGMEVHVEGRIASDSGEDTSFTKEDIDGIIKQVDQIAGYIDEVKWRRNGPPLWKIRIAQANDAKRSLKVVVGLEVPELTYRELTVRDVIAEAEYSGDLIKVKRLKCREYDNRGKLNMVAVINLRSRVVQAGFRSDVPLLGWAAQMDLLEELPVHVRLIDVPGMRGSAKLTFSEGWKGLADAKARGSVSVGRFEVGASPFSRFSGEFSYDNGNFYVTDFNLTHGDQYLKGQVMKVGEDLKFEVRSTFGVDEACQVFHEFTKEKLALPEGFEMRGRPDFLAKGDLGFKNGWDKTPEVNTAQLVFKVDDLSVMGNSLGSVILDAGMEGKKLTIRQCSIRNEDRRLDLKGGSIGDKVHFSCVSNLKPTLLNKFLDDFVQLPGQLELPENIDFKADGVIDFSSGILVDYLVLQLKTDGWKWNGVEFDGLDVQADLRRQFLLSGSCLISRGGRQFNLFAMGDIEGGMMALCRTAVRLDTFDKLLKLEDDNFFFERFKYMEDSLFDIGFVALVDLKSPQESFRATAAVDASNAYYRDVYVNNAHALVQIDLNQVVMTHTGMRINNSPYLSARKMRGGAAEGVVGASRIILDFQKDTATVEGLQSTSYPDYALKMFSDSASEVLSEFAYTSQVNISGNGVFPMGDDFSLMKGSLTFSSRNGRIDYKLLGTTLQMTNTSGTVTISPSWVRVSNLKGNIWGGVFNGKIDAQIDHGNEINGVIGTQGLNLAEIGKSYETKMAPAAVEASVSFRSNNGEVSTITGTGRVNISNGNLVEIPLFGSLLGKVFSEIPGLNQLTNYDLNRLNSEFEIVNGILKTTQFKTEGSNMSLEGSGVVNLETTHVDVGLRLRLKGLPGIIATPLRLLANRLFYIKGEGPLNKVEWSPDPLATGGRETPSPSPQGGSR